jgi:hypothetical protein
MEEYQVYVLSRAAELVEARRLIARSDSIALAKTATLRKQGRCEVWQGDRLVARLYDPFPSQPSPSREPRSSPAEAAT